jgi:hypothetical protein
LDGRQWSAISRLVSERGGSAILVTGDPSIASGYASHAQAAALIPWRGDTQPASRVWPGEDPLFRIVPAAQDVRDTLTLSDDSETNKQRWADLPTVFRFLTLPALKPNARPLLVERDSDSPVLTEARVGAGRVFMFGLNETWRWRASVPARERDRFWIQLVQHAGHEPYAVSDGPLRLDAEPLRSEPDQPIHVRAHVRGSMQTLDGEPIEPPLIQVFRGDTVVYGEELTEAIGSTERFDAIVPELRPGKYQLRLSWERRSIALPIDVEESGEAELSDVSGDSATLQRFAARTDVLELADVQSLPQRIGAVVQSQPSINEVRLWDSPYLFLLVLACLGIEWAVRKRVGLA